MAAYYERYPDVQLSLSTGHTQFLTDKVLRYELDGAFIGCHIKHPELQSVPAFEEEAVVVTPAAVTDLEEAVKKPILVYSTDCTYRDTLERWLHSAGTAHPAIMEFGTLEAIIGGVTAGLGITLLPKSVIEQHAAQGSVQTWTIPKAFSFMKTAFVTRKDSYMSSALRAFIDSFSAKKASGTSI
ncbi:LysR substrate-binding domain-containing protein [Bacillus nakamurai]|nr:LysR substrate-binding domain-containing protein [Bacillus nakamurai]